MVFITECGRAMDDSQSPFGLVSIPDALIQRVASVLSGIKISRMGADYFSEHPEIFVEIFTEALLGKQYAPSLQKAEAVDFLLKHPQCCVRGCLGEEPFLLFSGECEVGNACHVPRQCFYWDGSVLTNMGITTFNGYSGGGWELVNRIFSVLVPQTTIDLASFWAFQIIVAGSKAAPSVEWVRKHVLVR